MNMKQHIYSHILFKNWLRCLCFYVFYFEIIKENKRFLEKKILKHYEQFSDKI